MLPISPEAYRPPGWTRRTRTEPILVVKLFPPRHLQFERSLSYTPAYCSDRQVLVRVSDRLFSWRDVCRVDSPPGSHHALSQVTNHAPSKPKSTPSNGLEMANQKGIASLNKTAPRATLAV